VAFFFERRQNGRAAARQSNKVAEQSCDLAALQLCNLVPSFPHIMKRWLLIIGFVGIGLVIGIGLGLFLGWIAWPTEFTDANPSVLAEEYKQDYVLMVAADYAFSGDLDAARQKVASLGSGGEDFIFSFTLDQILQSSNVTEIRQLAQLANDLGLYSPAMDPYLNDEVAP
jgi:hypothetical protein